AARPRRDCRLHIREARGDAPPGRLPRSARSCRRAACGGAGRVRRAAALLALAVLAAGCGHHARAVPPGAIAVVGDRAISRADFDAELARAQRAYGARGQSFPKPGTAAYEQVKD